MPRYSRIRALILSRRAIVALLTGLAVHLTPLPLWAQLPGGLGGSQGGGGLLGNLGGGGLPSVAQAGPANTAGVLQYCVQNNYLEGGAAGAAKSALLGKPGSGQTSSGYQTGSKGLLQTGNGQTYNLSSGSNEGGIKAQVTHKVCDLVLQHAKSLL